MKTTKKATGRIFENKVRDEFISRGYEVISYTEYLKRLRIYGRAGKWLVKNYPYTSSFGKNGRIEWFDAFEQIAIECKYQEVEGTAKEKIFYAGQLLLDLPHKSIVIYQGDPFTQGFIKMAKKILKSLAISNDFPVNKVKYLSFTEFTGTHKFH